MDNRRFRRWVGSPWSRVGAGICALFVPLLSFGCRAALETPAIQQPPSNQTQAERIKAQEQGYQAKFDQQPPDDAARKIAQERLSHVTVALAGTKVQRLECHRELCRLETLHENDAALQKFIQAAFMDVRTAWHGPFAVVRVDHAGGLGERVKESVGPVSALVFLGEERHDWPKIPEAPPKGADQKEPAPSPKSEKP